MHTHSLRARTAAVLVAVAAAAGCADSEPNVDEPRAGPQTTASTPPAAGGPDAADTSEEEEEAIEDSDPDVEVVEVAIIEGRVRTERSRVDVVVGTAVRIEVRADFDEEVHVHGYDLFAPVSPAETAVLEFTADIPGAFEVEAEHSGLELFQLRVR